MRRGCGCRGRASRLQARSEVQRAGRRGVSHRWRVWRPRHELLAVLPRAPAHPVSRLWAQPQGSAPPRNSRSSREKSTSLWARGGPRDAQLPVGRRGCGAVGGRTPVGGRSVLFVTQKMPCGSFVWPRGRERNVAKEQLAIKQRAREFACGTLDIVMSMCVPGYRYEYVARAIRANPLLRLKRCPRAMLGLGLQLAVGPRCA